MERVFVSLPKNILAYVRGEADRRCQSMSAIVRELTIKGFENHNIEKEKTND
mgnify:CR=1 FL=1